MSCYQDKLYDDDVYHNFTTISTRTKKFAKPEVKVGMSCVTSHLYSPTPLQLLLEELEEQWRALHDKGTTDPSSPPSRDVEIEKIRGDWNNVNMLLLVVTR